MGLSYNDLVYAEECFDLCITVLFLQPDGSHTAERRCGRSSGRVIF